MEQEAFEGQELHIRDYLRVVYKRRLAVLAVFCLIVTVVVTRTLLATPIYQATSRVIIERESPQNLSVVNPYYTYYDPDFYNTQAQLIRSEAIGRKVVDMLSLDTNPLFVQEAAGEGKGSEEGKGAGTGEEVPPDLQLGRMVADSLEVTPVKESKIVSIGYSSPNPELAALIVNATVDAYREELLEMKMSSSRYAISWMTEKAKEEAAKLEDAERSLQAYVKANDIVTLENRIAIVPQRLQELSAELTRAETRLKELEAVYAKVSSFEGRVSGLETLPQVESSPTLQSLRQQILKAEQNILELSKKYGEKHPSMIVARKELESLQAKRSQEVGRVVESIRNEYEFALQNERNLRRRLEETKGETLDLNEKFIQYEVLKRAVDTGRQFYDALMTKTKEQSITEQIQTINVWVLGKAEVPMYPVRPNKRRNVLLGLVLGLFGGVGMAFFVEYLDNTVKSAEEIEQRTGRPVLGIIPRFTEKGRKVEGAVLENPTSPIGESYKALRTSLLLSQANHPPKTMLFSSAIPGEGKTATAINTAVATALSGYKVLLVDGDLRRHRVHRVFNIPNVRGLSTYLAGVSDGEIITPTPVDNLSIVTPGPMPPNPSELMNTSRMEAFVRDMEKRFDIIIFDSSPILTVTDSLVLSRYMEATILVVRAGKTTYEMMKRALRMLDDVKATVQGVVLNSYDEKRGGYYFYHRDNYYYRFNQDADGKEIK